MNLLQPSSLAELTLPEGGVLIAGGTEVVPLMREGLLHPTALVDLEGVVPRGIEGGQIGAGTTLSQLAADFSIPEVLREASRRAASPQIRAMGTLGGNLLQQPRCWYWRLGYRCRLHGGEHCHAREGAHSEHAIFANDFCAAAHPSDPAAALLALGARLITSKRELLLSELYRLPGPGSTAACVLEPGEVLMSITIEPPDASVYLKAMARKTFGFPLVGVAAVRRADSVVVALAGVAPVPWLLDGPLEDATPLPQNAYKLAVARALIDRAIATIAPG